MTQAFNLSQLANNVNTSGQLNAAAGLYNQTPVANGGTGVATVASGAILVGAGTSAMTAVPAATANNVLTANGTAWVSSASQGGPAPIVRVYTSPSPWTKSPTLKGVNVTLLSGGGSGSIYKGPAAGGNGAGGGGGSGGMGSIPASSIPGPLTVTVGAGGAAAGPGANNSYTQGNTGGSSSFGALLSCTGGAGGSNNGGGATGSFTPSPTAIGFSGTAGTPSTVPTTVSGGGGNSFQLWGFGGSPLPVSPGPAPVPGTTGTGYGGGGGGSYCANAPGVGTSGPGTAGYVVVEEFY